MVDKVVTDSFNIYDLFGRFGPGCIFVACFYCCCKSIFPNIAIGNTYLQLIVYISLSYIIGSTNQALSRWVVSAILNKKIFGGNPRELYTFCPNKKDAVLKHEVSRELARRIRDIVAGHYTSIIREVSAQSDQSNIVQRHVDEKGDIRSHGRVNAQRKNKVKKVNHFVFGYMTNYLDIKGLAGKNSRINSLADMCSSVIVTALLCYITWIPTFVYHIKQDYSNGISDLNYYLSLFVVVTVVILFVFFSACKMYRTYIQMRYAIVVYQFAICNEWVKKELLNEISEEC